MVEISLLSGGRCLGESRQRLADDIYADCEVPPGKELVGKNEVDWELTREVGNLRDHLPISLGGLGERRHFPMSLNSFLD